MFEYINKIFKVSSGVQQRFYLAHILFLLYINDISLPHSKLLLFADYLKMYYYYYVLIFKIYYKSNLISSSKGFQPFKVMPPLILFYTVTPPPYHNKI
jgi:hypothetical protein